MEGHVSAKVAGGHWKASIGRRQAALRDATPKAFDHAKASVDDLIDRVGEPEDEDGNVLPYRRKRPASASAATRRHREKTTPWDGSALSGSMSWRNLAQNAAETLLERSHPDHSESVGSQRSENQPSERNCGGREPRKRRSKKKDRSLSFSSRPGTAGARDSRGRANSAPESAGGFSEGSVKTVKSPDSWRKTTTSVGGVLHIDVENVATPSTMRVTAHTSSKGSKGSKGSKESKKIFVYKPKVRRKRTAENNKRIERGLPSKDPRDLLNATKMYHTPIMGLFDHKHPGKRCPPLNRSRATSKESTGAPNDLLSLHTPDYAADDAASDNSATGFWSPSKSKKSPLRTPKRWHLLNGKLVSHRSFSVMDFKGDGRYFGTEARENFYELYRKVDRQRSTTNDIIEYIPEKDQYAQLEKFMDEDTLAVDQELRASGIISDNYSPRQEYVRRLVNERDKGTGVLPVPLILRQAVTGEINLSHKSLGDVPMKIFAEVLDLMPNLRVLNVRDNRLTDASIETLVYAVCHPGAPDRGCGALESLDLSENDLDMKSVVQLADFLEEDPTLEHLGCSKADIDDSETVVIMHALETNRNLKRLDLSNNIIGGRNERMQNVFKAFQIKNDVVADDNAGDTAPGGHAIANMLDRNVGLELLNLQWNSFSSRSGVPMGKALTYNESLRDLNLAYNQIECEGAEAFGKMLCENHTLTRLNLSYNDIRNHGAVVLAEGLNNNKALKHFSLDGNPLGHYGGRAILRSFNHAFIRRLITTKNATFDLVDTRMLERLSPGGDYVLQMESPLDFTVAKELLRLATTRNGCSFGSVTHIRQMNAGPMRTKVTLRRPEVNSQYFGDHSGDDKDNSPVMSPTKSSHGSPSRWRKAQKHYVKDSLVMSMRANDMETEMERYNFICEETGKKWEIPIEGTLEISFVYEPRPPTELVLTNMSGLQSLIYLLLEQPNRLEILQLACTDWFFVTVQAQQIVDMTREKFESTGKDTLVDVFACLLPKIIDRENIRQFINTNLSTRQARSLHANLGSCFQVLVGVPCGHYRLDLANQNDRQCFLRLAETDSMEQSWLKDHKKAEHRQLRREYGQKHAHMVEVLKKKADGGYSQHGNWTGFRNVTYMGRELAPSEFPKKFFSETLTQARQGAASARGLLEFDFASPMRPPVDARAITMGELVNVAKKSGFVDDVHSHNEKRGKAGDSSSLERPSLSTIWIKSHCVSKTAYQSHTDVFSHADLEKYGDEGFAQWLEAKHTQVTSAQFKALLADLESQSCEMVHSEETGTVRFMQVMKVRISHPVRGMSTSLHCKGMWADHLKRHELLLDTTKEHTLQASSAVKEHKHHVRVVEDKPVTFYCKVLPIESGIPIWNLEICAKKLVQSTLAHLDLEATDLRVLERCGYNEEEVSPYHPATLKNPETGEEPVRTLCVNHYYECYAKNLPIAHPETYDHNGRERTWDWCLTDEADTEPYEDEPMSRRLLELRFLTGPIYLTTDQVAKICDLAYAHAKRTGENGLNAMIEILIITRTRLVDLENIQTVVDNIISKMLTTASDVRKVGSREWITLVPPKDVEARRLIIGRIARRVGYLNFLNFEKDVDIPYDLYLTKRDNRLMTLVLTKLAIDEGLKNFVEATFRRKECDPLTKKPSEEVHGYLHMGPPAKWDDFNQGGKAKKEEEKSEFEEGPGVPPDGILRMEGYCSEGQQKLHEATAERRLMSRFLSLVGCSRPDMPVFEIENHSHLRAHNNSSDEDEEGNMLMQVS